MTKIYLVPILILTLGACSSAKSKVDARGPTSVVDATGTVVKKLGIKTQVIATGVINQNADAAKHGQISFDVLCPEEAPEVYSGGCTITDGATAKATPSTGVVTGLYPLVSAESGEGYRCIFDRTKRQNEISAMAFCRKAFRAQRRVAAPVAPLAE